MRTICYVQDSLERKSSCGLERPNPANGSFDHLESGFAFQFGKITGMVCFRTLIYFLKMFENQAAVTN